jgi:NADH-quinone oxidoreductase subunit B
MGLEAKLNSDGFLTTQLDAVVAWARKNSVYPMPWEFPAAPLR